MPREDIVTVTSENHQQFVDEQLGVKTESPKEEVKEEPKSLESQAQEELDKLNAEKAKKEEAEKAEADPTHDIEEDKPIGKDKKSRLNERFSELTHKRKSAEQERDQARKDAQAHREAKEKLERELNELRTKYEPPKTEADPEPQRQQFQSDADFIKAVKDWSADNALREAEKRKAEEAAKAEQQKIVKQWQERQTAFQQQTPDYAEVLGSSSAQVKDHIRDAILESDVGPQLLYFLAKNPDQVDKLNDMSVPGALKELGRMEDKLGKPKSEVKDTKETKVSSAPAPISPLSGGSGVPVVPKSETMTYDEWKQHRQAGRIK